MRRRIALIAALTVLALAGLGALGVAAVVGLGLYDVSATSQHTAPVYALLEKAMHQSVRLRSRGIEPPPALADGALVERGALCFRDKCVQCHGAPGVAQGDIGRSMQPLPGPLVDAHRKWQARELYWITRHGIKMSGMPAWEYRLPDADLWAVVAFLQRLPALDAPGYRRTMAALDGQRCEAPPDAGLAPAAGDPERGLRALHQHACNACHRIPGVTGSKTDVGPPLEGVGRRGLIAGALPNTPDNMARWLRDPAAVDPHTAMPALGVSERDARDMAAYLATLR